MANEKEPKNKKKFFKDFKAELKRVIWPTPKQLVNNTAAVVVIVIITAAIVFGLDFTFELLHKYGINKIKSNYRGNNAVIVEQTVDNTAGNTEQNEINNGEVYNLESNVVENNPEENPNTENNIVNE